MACASTGTAFPMPAHDMAQCGRRQQDSSATDVLVSYQVFYIKWDAPLETQVGRVLVSYQALSTEWDVTLDGQV